MPPAHLPDPERTFMSALRELASPVNDDVLNLAATLGTPTHPDEAIADDEHDQARLERSRERQRLRLLERQRDELEQRDRLRRVMSRLSRLSDNNYGDRVPRQNSLYDWSPASDAPASGSAPESSLRSTAMLQSAGVRRHGRFSARPREAAAATMDGPPGRMAHASLRDMLHQRVALQNEPPARDGDGDGDTTARPSPMLEQTVTYLSRIRQSNSADESLECARDLFGLPHADLVADAFAIPPPTETSWLVPGAVLSGCQHATTTNMTASLPPAIRPWTWNPHRNAQPPDVPPQQDRWPVKVTIHDVDWDAMSLSATMEAYNVPSHPHSHATLPTPTGTAPPATRTSSITTYLQGEILDFNTHTLLTESFKSTAANDATYWRKLPPFQKMSDQDVVRALTSKNWLADVLAQEWILMRWKEQCFVKSLNRSTPDPAQPPASTTIASFPSPPPGATAASSTHASQLAPSPYRIVRNAATGRAQVEITPQPPSSSHNSNDAEHATFDDSGCGLTISGFYYVALHRTTGALEGLYYDPQSSPYQCLKLESVRGGLRPAWAFR